MANITINIPDDKINAVVDAFATQYKYSPKVEDDNNQMVDNPVSKAQFARNILKSFVKQVYIAAQVAEVEATKQAAIATATTEVDGVDVT